MSKQTIEERAKELQRQYLRQWRAKNKDKVIKYNAEYWIRKAEKAAEESKDD